ncbi:hypothetical protein J2Z40_000117 [Cytobacillus eiseniae]|uniref:Uncharacterized protein n=1 Tax=Cytobacillus eiseniae TaxID=762947 RepID=A0ABS4RB61_9BACI|nr:hypothetical protein [Cytobacillus eiseniae]MBP2239564.1 hypothetical protein [Cytobacillus eiseniae]
MKRKERKDILSNNNQANDLAAQLLKNQDSLDFGSLMNMANHLLKDDSLMEMVEELGNSNHQVPRNQSRNINPSTDFSILQQQMDELRTEITQIKKDIAGLKKQNPSLLDLGMKVVNTTSGNLFKGFSLLQGARSLLK